MSTIAAGKMSFFSRIFCRDKKKSIVDIESDIVGRNKVTRVDSYKSPRGRSVSIDYYSSPSYSSYDSVSSSSYSDSGVCGSDGGSSGGGCD